MNPPLARRRFRPASTVVASSLFRLTARGLTFLLLTWSVAAAAEFHVAPTGSDDADGSAAHPFASLQRAQREVQPGDTVWISGGTYRMTEAQIARREGPYAQVIVLDRSGTEGKPIRYLAREGEQPVFDFSAVKPKGLRVAAFRVTGSWLHLAGFEVVGVQVTLTGHTQSICFDNQGSHNRYERLAAHDGQAIGFWIGGGSHNLVLNCDAYRNHDDVSGDRRGGNVDGFGYHGRKGSVGNVFRGCRAWFNSDDGFDFINSGEAARAENCWAFWNGFSPKFERLADGNGFKAGGHAGTPAARLPDPIPRHVVTGCLAVRNKANGFYANHHIGGVDFIANTAGGNAAHFNLLGRERDNRTEIPGRGHRVAGNLAFGGRAALVQIDRAACEVSGNSFDLPAPLTADDLLSLDESELVQPRRPDGSLPEIRLLRPRPGRPAEGLGRP